MGVAWMATTKPFTVMHSSQFFAPGPPRLTSRRYTRDYNEVKALGRNVGSTRTPEQTAIAMFHSGNTLVLWNQTLRALADAVRHQRWRQRSDVRARQYGDG